MCMSIRISKIPKGSYAAKRIEAAAQWASTWLLRGPRTPKKSTQQRSLFFRNQHTRWRSLDLFTKYDFGQALAQEVAHDSLLRAALGRLVVRNTLTRQFKKAYYLSARIMCSNGTSGHSSQSQYYDILEEIWNQVVYRP